MTLRSVAEALDYVRTHGVVPESARGPVTSLVSAIAGEPIRGSWWSHARGREIFALMRALRASPDVLVCRLVDGKITYVHRRLWPALVRVADCFPPARLAQVRERHTASGRHVTEGTAFVDWVTPQLRREALRVDLAQAVREFQPWISVYPVAKGR